MQAPIVAGGQRVLVLYPRQLEDAQLVIDAVKDNQAVVLNTSLAADGEAQRLIDFACGGMEALEAQVHRLDAETFLFAPGHAGVAQAPLAVEQP
jgi:cell division inhibitor SepF